MRVLRRKLRDQRGQSLMELAMFMPVLLILVFGVIDFGLGMRSYISLSNGVREGARFAALGNETGQASDCNGVSDTTVYGKICSTVDGLDLDQLTPSVAYPDGFAAGNEVIVSADYDYNFVTPLGDLISFFTGGAFPTTISLASSTNMRVE